MSANSRPAIAVITAAVLTCFAAAAAAAEASSEPAQTPSAVNVAAGENVAAGDLSLKTDTELTELTAQWSTLSPGERRHLLAEVTRRMAANRNARAKVGVQVQRRYGRVVRKQDGSVVVQTRVVQMRPRPDGATAVRGRVTFGIGFEQRSKSRQANPVREPAPQRREGSGAPAVTVSQPSNADPQQ